MDIEWECLTRPDCLDEGLISLMLEAHCVQVRLGLESGSQRILDHLQKRASVEDYKCTAAILNRLKMFWSAYVMVGTPEEKLEDIQMTIALIERTQPGFITISRFVPLPGTPLYREIEREGRRIDWTRENNMCIDSCYSRHISAEIFRTIMERLGEYADDYNKRHSDGHSWRDRRLRDGYEGDNPNAGGAVHADNHARSSFRGL
jgi:anaerobic magnesium-protoporphyrin IX monomethyl ester cyclase